jgi:hypothetical protein
VGKYVLFFSVVQEKIVCLICTKEVSVPKEYSLCHLETIYKEKFGLLEDELMEGKLNLLKSNLQWQRNVFVVANKLSIAVVYVNFAVLQVIAKQLKLFTYTEFVKKYILRLMKYFALKNSIFLKLSVCLQIQ